MPLPRLCRIPRVQARLENLGIYPGAAGSPAEVDQMLKAESRRWEASFEEMKLEKQMMHCHGAT
jgi:tripartite-type tricarboxylate transporter receptor subunit TctC